MDLQSGQVSSQLGAARVDKTLRPPAVSRMRRLMADEMSNPLPDEPPASETASGESLNSAQVKRGVPAERIPPERLAGAAKALTGRAVGLGLVLVAFVAAFTPYNDYVLQNSPFIGNHFPIGIMTLMAVLLLVVNPGLMVLQQRGVWK